jgi:ubiquinone/menaquinone biosynthesis C-methylase UbiE
MGTAWSDIAEVYDTVAKKYDDWTWQHFWEENEFPIIKAAFERYGRVNTSLDIGIGTGAYYPLEESYSERVLGIDLSIGMLDILLQQHTGAAVACAVADAVPVRSDSVDRVMINRVLSHLPLLHPVLAEVRRILRPGGTLIVSDLDAEHEYRVIRFTDGEEADANVLTPHKHSLEDLTREASAVGIRLQDAWRLRYSDLRWRPDRKTLPSVDRSGTHHIFYVAIFKLS